MAKVVTGIDVGTYNVKVVIAELESGRSAPRILGTGYAESRGMRQGYVLSVPEAARSISAALNQAARAARVRPKRAYIGIGGLGLEEATSRGEVVVERGDSEVTARDIPRAVAQARAALPPAAVLNRRVIHEIPLRFFVDGARVLGRSPVGLKGARLAVDMLFITALERHMHDLVAAVEEAGVEVDDVIASPIAASFVVLSKMQKRVGCVLANVGSETLSIAVFEDSIPISVKVFPVGGADITNDLALGLRIIPEEAEQLKHGAILGAPFPKRKIDDIIARRIADMFKLVETHLKKIHKDELLPAGVVITGGSSALTNIAEIAKSSLRLPSRTASAAEALARTLELRDASWAVACGLTVWGGGEGASMEVASAENATTPLSSTWRWLKKFLP
ncbi:MAG: cell division protein FtsA [Patescibacteria group bacterium]|nr:cell division protein FtsA [Patescibacteria group bacterium]